MKMFCKFGKRFWIIALIAMSLFAVVLPASAATCKHTISGGTLTFYGRADVHYQKLDDTYHQELWKKRYECSVCKGKFDETTYTAEPKTKHIISDKSHHIMATGGGPTNYHYIDKKCLAYGCSFWDWYETRCSIYPGCR